MKESVEQLPAYEPPEIVTYSAEVILEELGPAQTLYGPLANSY